MLNKTAIKRTLRVTHRDARIVWGSNTLREAFVWRDAARAIMAQTNGCEA